MRHFRVENHFWTVLQIFSLDFFEVSPGDRHQKVDKSKPSEVLKKILLMLKMEEKGCFCTKNQHFILFH